MFKRVPHGASSEAVRRDGGGAPQCGARLQLATLPPRVETIDTCSPEVAPLWAELRERGSALGLDGAYFLIVPSFEPGGARVAAAASARIRPLLETYRAGRNPEINVAIRSGFAGSEPGVWRPDALLAELPLPLRRARQAWMERVAEVWGVCLYHGFDVPVFAAGGWRGLFKINAPEGPITAALMREVHEATERFHRAYVRTRPQLASRLTELEAGALQLVGEGRCCKRAADALGISPKAAEKALERARVKLDAGNTTQAALRAYQLGLIT
jgi:DNA-binding CsgD family transcriptional regulator